MTSLAKCLYNSTDTLVRESIDGYLLTRPDLTRLDSYHTGTKVILRKARDVTKVAVISGGGAGHEPAHGGLVGEGMLTAAVSGEIFASPSMSAVLDAIRACCNPKNLPASEVHCAGALLVVKNYTGDRLAFGLAAQKARFEGIPVELVFVADDAAVDGGPVTGRRGIAGVAFVHKVAGAVAEAGGSLEAVTTAASLAADLLSSAGASMSVCSVPGQVPSDRLAGAEAMEIGLGIHGEQGVAQVSVSRARDLANTLLDIVVPHLHSKYNKRFPTSENSPDTPSIPLKPVEVALLVNNLGGLSVLEANAFTHAIVQQLHSYHGQHQLPPIPGVITALKSESTFPLVVRRVVTAPLVTSLDMKGISISLLPLSHPDGTPVRIDTPDTTSATTLLGAFDAPTTCVHWPVVQLPHINASTGCRGVPSVVPDTYVPPPEEQVVEVVSDSGSDGCFAVSLATLQKVTEAMFSAMKESESLISHLDSIAGDGDAGFTHVQVFSAIQTHIATLTHKLASVSAAPSPTCVPLAPVLANLSHAVSLQAGGTSGVLYAIALQAAANSVAATGAGAATPVAVAAEALQAATAACTRLGGAKEGSRTLLDALIPAQRVLARHTHGTTEPGAGVVVDLKEVCREAAKAAEAGAVKTAELTPQVGRASYVQAQVALGNKDPGAVAVAMWMHALAEAL